MRSIASLMFGAWMLTTAFAARLPRAETNPFAQNPSIRESVPPELARELARLFPDTTIEDDGHRPYFTSINLLHTFDVDGRKYRIVWVARARVRDPLLLILGEAGNIVMDVSGVPRERVEVIDNRWLRIEDWPLVSLTTSPLVCHGPSPGSGALFHRLAFDAVRRVNNAYLNEGREGLLRLAPAASHQEHVLANLPDAITRADFYAATVDDFRLSGFRYSSPWEGRMYVRVIPKRRGPGTTAPVILEFAVSGWAEGISPSEVEVTLWAAHAAPPDDRPPLPLVE